MDCLPGEHVIDTRNPDRCIYCRADIGALWGFPPLPPEAEQQRDARQTLLAVLVRRSNARNACTPPARAYLCRPLGYLKPEQPPPMRPRTAQIDAQKRRA